MISNKHLCGDIIAEVTKIIGNNDWLLINYGSIYEIYDENKDFDCCVYAENVSHDQRIAIARLIEQKHTQYNLKIDLDMKYINKTSFSREDIDILIAIPPFPLDSNNNPVLSPVKTTEEFLDSHNMRLRLLLNILTKGSVLIYGDEKKFDCLIDEAYLAFAKILLRVGNKPKDTDEIIDMLYTPVGKAVCYKCYLGYEQNNAVQKQYIKNKLKTALDSLCQLGVIYKDDERYHNIEIGEKSPKIIYITGASGSGTSSLGSIIKSHFDVNIVESDDITMYPTNPPYKYPRPLDERGKLLQMALTDKKLNVIVGSINEWGNEFIRNSSMFVLLYEKFEIRKQRITYREEKRFGDRLYYDPIVSGGFNRLLSWSEKYDSFSEPRSLGKHLELYNTFEGKKYFFKEGQTTQQIFDSIKDDIELIINK